MISKEKNPVFRVTKFSLGTVIDGYAQFFRRLDYEKLERTYSGNACGKRENAKIERRNVV